MKRSLEEILHELMEEFEPSQVLEALAHEAGWWKRMEPEHATAWKVLRKQILKTANLAREINL